MKYGCWLWTDAVNIAPDQGAEGQVDPKLVGNEEVTVGQWQPNWPTPCYFGTTASLVQGSD